MKKYLKFLGQLIISFINGVLGAVFGFIIGIIIGGNFGFPKMFGLVGYESGGIFFTIVGISIGCATGIWLIDKYIRKNYKPILITAIITAIISLFAYEYYKSVAKGLTPISVGFIFALFPTIVLVFTANIQKHLKK